MSVVESIMGVRTLQDMVGKTISVVITGAGDSGEVIVFGFSDKTFGILESRSGYDDDSSIEVLKRFSTQHLDAQDQVVLGLAPSIKHLHAAMKEEAALRQAEEEAKTKLRELAEFERLKARYGV